MPDVKFGYGECGSKVDTGHMEGTYTVFGLYEAGPLSYNSHGTGIPAETGSDRELSESRARSEPGSLVSLTDEPNQ